MRKKRKAPVLVTKLGEFTVEGGVLFITFWSGEERHVVAMGPAIAFRGIASATKAMKGGVIDNLIAQRRH